ncbi:transglutaminase domain-containing protein [Microbacterium bovistercoris]|uniref:Transglutaminase domain-containing protein n=1 Tax=Microbacterium bovistercoris TaxID=2293570 RepID=A0A371NVU7_9MICO|nr:transglutaminaseTgpA domain-containing protein [Microbacterium bovistercoris]REJ06856.1 transglutaminase domain-containing protein [Microbacterium bovistercoris]
MTSPRISARRWIVDLTASALLLAVAVVGFWPTFAGPAYLPAAVGAVILGLGIAAVSAWRRWGILIIAGLTIAAYFVFGGALALPFTTIAGVVPTLDTLQRLALGAITSWKQLLTTVAPVSVTDGHALVPFLLLLVASVLTGSLALRLRSAGWALIPAGVAVGFGIALGVPSPAAPIAQGVVFALVSVGWLALRQIWAPQNAAVSVSEVDPTRAAHMRWRRIGAGAAVLVVAAGAGIATSAFAQPNQPRHVFRDTIVPPFNIREYPSPLQSYRKYVRDDLDNTLFTVRGLPEGARMRLAAMDDFNGQVYNVSDAGNGSSGAFTPLRGNMSVDAEGDRATLKVEIDDYDQVWIPTAGQVNELEFTGDRAEELRRSTYYNESSATAITTTPLAEGDAYTLETTLPVERADKTLGDAKFGSVSLPKQSDVPEELSGLAADVTEDAETPIEKVAALEVFLAEGGFFSHGLEGEVISRAGHTSERISTLIGGDQMIGDDEQYAVAMTLLARELDIPARVVMGFYPDEEQAGAATFPANGDTLHAWVEVNFAGHGWVAFDPTPPEDKVPNDQNTKPRADPKPQVLQPPPPPQEPVDLPPTLPDDREPEDDAANIWGIIAAILAIGGISLGVIALLASPFIVIGAWKAARRRRRRNAERTSDRISGGWDELTDRASDYGAHTAPGATRAEDATAVAATLAVPAVTALADRADAQVFGPADPTPEDVDAFWREVDGIVAGMGAEAGFWRRLRARLSLRSLLGGGVMASKLGELKDAAAARVRREGGTIDKNTSASPDRSAAPEKTAAPESETK